MATNTGGASSLRRSATNVYRRLLNFDSPLAAMGLENIVPKGEEKLLKASFYQAATIFVLTFGLIGVYSLYLILSPFVKPILWAILVGTVLHPFQLAITHTVRSWLRSIGSNSAVPILSFHILVSPVRITWSLLTYLQQKFWSNIIPLAAGSFTLVILCMMVRLDFPFLRQVYALQFSLFDTFGIIWNALTLPWPAYLAFVLGYAVVAFILPPNYWPPVLLNVLPVLWWIMLSFMLFTILGPLSMMLFICLLVPLSVIAASSLFKAQPKDKEESKDESKEDDTQPSLNRRRPSLRTLGHATKFIAALSPRLSTFDLNEALITGKSGPLKNGLPNSSKPANQMILGVLGALILIHMISHPIFLALLAPCVILPKVILMISQIEQVSSLKERTIETAKKWFSSRHGAILPPVISQIGTYLLKGDAKIRRMIDSCLEECVTAILILGVVLAICFTVFIAAAQLHRETIYVFTMSNELLNQTLHPEVNRLLENTDMNVTSLHDVVTNAADYGRQFFNSTIDHWAASVPDFQREQLRVQLLDAYDLMSTKLFESWNKGIGPTTSFPNNISDDNQVGWFRQNVEGLMEISHSLWALVKENAGVILAVLYHVSSALLIGSWAILDFTVSSVVFLTTLYYLLSASGQTYKPAQLLISLTPFEDDETHGGSNVIARAIDSGIRGVFYATFKMIVFYGFYTWFLHSVFEIGVVFLPSLCAAVMAAVPIVGAYWACLPGVFQLWLISDRGFAAILFFCLHMLPLYFVDTLIYADIKGGGHPYLTGLAIVGGVSCLGMEGAIFGPVLLCLIVVLMNLYRGILHTNNNKVSKKTDGTNFSKSTENLTPAHKISTLQTLTNSNLNPQTLDGNQQSKKAD